MDGQTDKMALKEDAYWLYKKKKERGRIMIENLKTFIYINK